jgi:predicted dienelactone hydrolase
MRLLESLIPLLLAVYLLWPHRERVRSFIVRILPAGTLGISLLHFMLEGFRWQMIPLYTLSILLALSSLTRIYTQRDWPTLAPYLTIILLAASTALPILLPVPSIADPDGAFEVGTTSFELTDQTRKELYSATDEPRRFTVQMWYPATPQPGNRRAPWMEHAEIFAPAIASYLGLPSFFLDHLTLVQTPAYQDAPIAVQAGGFPVIIFSHGWNGFNAQNTGQAVHLASHGFIVIAINHTYGAVATVFQDGRIAYNNPAALPEGAPDQEYEVAAGILVDQWAGDIAYTLEELALRNRDLKGPYSAAFDLTHLGVYGHSTGGGAAVQFCGTDPRCTALLGLDPFMRPVSPEVLANGVFTPSAFFFSQKWADDVDSRNNALFDRFLGAITGPVSVFSIQGTEHYDFSDLPMLSPLAPQLGLKGPINGRRVTLILNDYLLAFFNLYLKGLATGLFDGPSLQYPEVHFLAE